MRSISLVFLGLMAMLSATACAPQRLDAIVTKQNKCKAVVETWKATCEKPYSKCLNKAGNETTKRATCIDRRDGCNRDLDAKTKAQKNMSLWDCI